MSEELLVKHCSPTLAGIKTGNLFSVNFDNADELRACVRSADYADEVQRRPRIDLCLPSLQTFKGFE